jgi:hypothetical protein
MFSPLKRQKNEHLEIMLFGFDSNAITCLLAVSAL